MKRSEALNSSVFQYILTMVHSIFSFALVVPFLALSFASPTLRSILPLCSDICQPCSCPTGATFENITTYATIGAKADDIANITNDCRTCGHQQTSEVLTLVPSVFSTSWFNLSLQRTTGIDNVYGATRTFSIGGNATLTEMVPYGPQATRS